MSKYTDPDGECLICGYVGVDIHHVKTRGAGGPDEAWNMVKLCHGHHQQLHTMGDKKFSEKHGVYREWLTKNRWKVNPITNKWYREYEA